MPDIDTNPRLEHEPIIWLTTVNESGQPQSSPVWFLLDGDDIVVYSKPTTAKVRNIGSNPRVALNLDGNGQGGDIVTLEGLAAVAHDQVGAHEWPAFVDKYRRFIARGGWTPESFSAEYSLPIRIEVTKVRAW